MTRDYPTLRSVVGFASSLTTGGVSNSCAPPGLLDILLSSDYSIATSLAEYSYRFSPKVQ